MLRPISILLLFTCSACSIHSAATAPAPVEYERVGVGSNREAVIATLGVPRSTERSEDGITDTYEFTDGFQQASKARTVLYGAGAVLTLGLSELIFWPLEEAALQGTDMRAVVNYGPDNKVVSFKIRETDGELVASGGPVAEPKVIGLPEKAKVSDADALVTAAGGPKQPTVPPIPVKETSHSGPNIR